MSSQWKSRQTSNVGNAQYRAGCSQSPHLFRRRINVTLGLIFTRCKPQIGAELARLPSEFPNALPKVA